MLHIGRIALSTKDIEDENIGICIGDTLVRFCAKNRIKSSQVKAIIFSQTDDIDTWNPAQCLRKATHEYDRIALFCTKEPEYLEGILEKGIRLMVFFHKITLFPYTPIPIYMYGAEHLRKDITR